MPGFFGHCDQLLSEVNRMIFVAMQKLCGILTLLCSALTRKVEATMYQVDTSLTMYTLKQAEAVIAQSNAMFSKMIDDSLALNRAMMDFSFVEMTPAETIELMFPSVASGDAKKKSAKSERASETKAIAQAPIRQDDLKQISGVGPGLEKKLQDAGITSYAQIAALTDAEIQDLEANVVKFAGRIKRDDWIGQAQQLMGA
jgi:predicted flap endonuclease-1-like 5' DNA nuclease